MNQNIILPRDRSPQAFMVCLSLILVMLTALSVATW